MLPFCVHRVPLLGQLIDPQALTALQLTSHLQESGQLMLGQLFVEPQVMLHARSPQSM